MLQHAHLIDHDPAFSDLAVFDARIDKPLNNDRFAGGWVAQEWSFVRSAHRPMRRDFVTLVDFIIDSALKIRKRRSKHGDQLLEAHPVGGHSPTQMMANGIRRDQFIYEGEIALVEGFIKDTVEDGSTLHS